MDIEQFIKANQVETKGGHPVRILCTDRAHAVYPVVGLVRMGDQEKLHTWKSDGVRVEGRWSELDLVPVKVVDPAEFPWKVIPEKFRYAAMDKDRKWWVYQRKPVLKDERWDSDYGSESLPIPEWMVMPQVRSEFWQATLIKRTDTEKDA